MMNKNNDEVFSSINGALKKYNYTPLPFIPIDNAYDFKDPKDVRRIHFQNVMKMYDNAFNYISNLPCFHVGYFYATDKMANLAKKFGFAEKKNMLDLCCGLGGSMKRLHKQFKFKITGVDFNLKEIQECHRRLIAEDLEDDITLLCSNVLDLKSVGKFDIIWSEDSFSHVPDREKLFRIIYDSLKDDGLFVFSDLVKTSSIASTEIDSFAKVWFLWEIESIQSYQRLFDEVGFKISDVAFGQGKELVEMHIKWDMEMGDAIPQVYQEYFDKNEKDLIASWGEKVLEIRKEKMKMYNYLEKGKLDYPFFVAKKC
ncbi:MAG: methyltransferase domain-containing protein [Candidatus Aminicenantes bacterium]|nr:methyltransferase domain-containing protein [Candidatus Aminicenantes bacterium]